MPNHIHVLLYFPEMPKSLNIVISNAKRFIADEMIKRLEADKNFSLLEELFNSVKPCEKKKGQRHRVFADSYLSGARPRAD